jgi:hypothetical protein
MAKKYIKKMLTISGHKGNANQNHAKIPPHSWEYNGRNVSQVPTHGVPAHPCLW